MAEVSLPVRNTPSQPSVALKNGKAVPVAASARPSVEVIPEYGAKVAHVEANARVVSEQFVELAAPVETKRLPTPLRPVEGDTGYGVEIETGAAAVVDGEDQSS